MRRWRSLIVAVLLGLVALASLAPASAQVDQADPAFSRSVIDTLGLPEVEITFDGKDFVAPTEVASGPTVITLKTAPNPDTALYVNIVKVPAGLSPEEATAQMLDAARNDLPSEGWVYGGGSYSWGFDVSFVKALEPGEWTWALSDQTGQDGVETMHLLPFTVSGDATPAAASASPVAMAEGMVEVEEETRRYAGFDGTVVPSGARLYHFSNVGEDPHHLVLFRSPDGVTGEDVAAAFGAMMAGTPEAMAVMGQLVWTGYHSIMSPGEEIWLELDLEPGTYVVPCFIADLETGMPHMVEGMAQTFTVE